MFVKVPDEVLEKYRYAKGWNKFKNLKGLSESDSTIEEIISDDTKIELNRYDVNGKSVNEKFRGFVIIRYSDGSTKKILNK